jgi:hypothetical protein
MQYRVFGQVRESESHLPVPGVVVGAFDKDHSFDDLLGEIMTDPEGKFNIEYEEGRFRHLFDQAPDIYIKVKTASNRVLFTTEESVRFNAGKKEEFQLEIPAKVLRDAGIQTTFKQPTISRDKLKAFSCIDDSQKDDLAKQIRGDLEGKNSILEVLKDYMMQLRESKDNNSLPMRKLARLFELGSTPDGLEGHYYGVVPGLRTGDLRGMLAEYGNLLGYIWGSSIVGVCPWAGKSFTPMGEGDRAQVLGNELPKNVKVFRGINHFLEIERSAVNVAITDLLTFLWHLKKVPDFEHLKYGHHRNGGHFAAHRAMSVYPGTKREVFRLNYRYVGLDNFPPLTFLIDECVELADGVYLGQVLFATDRLLEKYDPRAPHENYHYQHFGYFVLFREEWNEEAQKLFPQLEIMNAAVTYRIIGSGSPGAPQKPDKFSTFTFADPKDGNVDETVLSEIKKDLSDAGTIVRLMKNYSDALISGLDNQSPVFKKLHTLFNAGIAPKNINGFYRGALVSWHSQGILAAFDLNSLNVGWRLLKSFSPWTGKRFDPVTKERLAELTDGYEKMEVPTYFCSNTIVSRTAKEKFTHAAAKIAGAWIQDASDEERRLYGYDAQTFFFISKLAPSIFPDNNGKQVLQFNYRWKKLKNPPPDCLCIDELVQIAEGFYLGQVFYSTNPLEPWNPNTPISKYNYKLFEYFVVMDEEWHLRRLRLGWDLADT